MCRVLESVPAIRRNYFNIFERFGLETIARCFYKYPFIFNPNSIVLITNEHHRVVHMSYEACKKLGYKWHRIQGHTAMSISNDPVTSFECREWVLEHRKTKSTYLQTRNEVGDKCDLMVTYYPAICDCGGCKYVIALGVPLTNKALN